MSQEGNFLLAGAGIENDEGQQRIQGTTGFKGKRAEAVAGRAVEDEDQSQGAHGREQQAY